MRARTPNRRLARQLATAAQRRRPIEGRVATVTAVGSTTATINFADGTSVAGVPCLDQLPTNGDTVLIGLVGNQAVILGSFL